jgi:hypothetical protein
VKAYHRYRPARLLLRRHLAFALVKIKRPVQLILLHGQFLKPRLMLERLAELLLVIVLF